ncbi:hypothetical protein DSO57_1007149 [Entomophthora muscae]|uniref:Uncharacterized protein n=1 Tax=Entomophthora muscae TaxID=34485 RepID=A0ACC2T7B9_9FUNG|nr:hypothetical protein DSO57_1007149 [Entomophthora muscae]
MIKNWDKEIAEAQDILAVLLPFGYTTTQVEISIQKVKIKDVLDIVSPENVVFSKLVEKLKLAPDLNYHQSYGTAGLSMTCAIGTFSALPMQFAELLLDAPAVVLENESYDLLVYIQFLIEYNVIINLKDGYLSIIGYEVPLIFKEPVKFPRKHLKTCVLEYPTGVFTLKYCTHFSNMKCPPMIFPLLSKPEAQPTSKVPTKQVCDPQSDYPVT